ncbi:binding-protein-dependent transport systems inner membrane component [Paenibacillus curdlanolyticus YK9]|uniref:Binding-protein-dependent transport systems inner membrane component n=1 Tax=Paenibacillus curdlanolyticus YK9 TaxID=717606 RepID=E0I7R8_9BACL|nr:sugar ABC transporter permease [Paenibacillus curdlanolyticus]EFM11223.1 binding-protein-dependent transport systems inner membrane component [Paenibacillus curdlanolyticus YK9]
MNAYRLRQKLWLAISYILLILIAIVTIYPALWIVFSSFREGSSLFSETLLPQKWTLEHYRELFTTLSFGTWYINSLKISIITMVLSVIFQLLTGYAFSRFRFKSRKSVMSGLFVIGLFPSFLSLMAVFVILNNMKLLNTHTALIMVSSAGAAVGYLLVKGYFDTIPKSLEEAAIIDGASNWGVFFRILLPLSRPLIVYMAVTSFAGTFSEFIFAQTILRTEDKQTLAVGLYNLVNTQTSTQFTVFAAGSVLVSIPVVLLFIFFQRMLVEGLTAGAEKG